MSLHDADLPLPTPQIREDGWSPARQRRFLETLAASGVVQLACESVRITGRSAYNLRNRRDGAAFRLGWDAAILIARARLADDLLARAIMGCTETVRRDEGNFEVTRHRHDNRLAMSMLSRLDRMADSPAEGTDAALARVVAQDFVAFLDLICPEDIARQEAEAHDLPRPGAEPSARAMADAHMLDGTQPDTPDPVDPAVDAIAGALSPGASAALFIAARTALYQDYEPEEEYLSEEEEAEFYADQEQCEVPPEEPAPLSSLPPEEAAGRLRGVWWNSYTNRWRTDFPAPPEFDDESTHYGYPIGLYERYLTPEEEEMLRARLDAQELPYVEAATRARDAYFRYRPSAQAPVEAPVEAPAGMAADAPA
ncbi:hypothetical protein ACFOKF_19695 [Sphingobium rhizovicinum]|uniref:Uncharacterized protein n=1 Tax=Sphingobium rhizovicinum TaxID=432308 RepID=A0ABV7NMJ5_9SPHN